MNEEIYDVRVVDIDTNSWISGKIHNMNICGGITSVYKLVSVIGSS